MPSQRTNQLLQCRSEIVDAPMPGRRVLVVEDRPFAADGVAAQLHEHGDVVVTWCRDVHGEVTCGYVVNQRCPLREPVELVIDVRSSAVGELTAGELGVACAGVAGIPIVAACSTRPGAEEAPWALATCAIEDAAGFSRQLLGHPGPWQELRLEDLVRRVLGMRQEDVGEVEVDVVRWPGAATVVVRTERLPGAASCAAVDRAVRGALRTDVGKADAVGLSFTTRVSTA